MPAKKPSRPTKDALAAARQSAQLIRQALGHSPPPSELLTPQEVADAAPFYFVLRQYIQHLKEAREAAGLTLADVAGQTGMAVEYLSRLETGAQTNPTWKTLGTYARALGRRPRLVLEALPKPEPPSVSAPAAQTLLVHPAEQYLQEARWASASTSVQGSTPVLAGSHG